MGTETGQGSPDGPASSERQRQRVALLVDWENFTRHCEEADIEVRAGRLKEIARKAGHLAWSAVFVDATTVAQAVRWDLFSSGFDIIDCPHLPDKHVSNGSKDMVDSAIIEKMHAVADFLPVDTVLIASADRDFLRAIQRVRDAGKSVVVLVPTSEHRFKVTRYADSYVPYAQSAPGADSALSAVLKNADEDAARAWNECDNVIMTAVIAGLSEPGMELVERLSLLVARIDASLPGKKNAAMGEIINDVTRLAAKQGEEVPTNLHAVLLYLESRDVLIGRRLARGTAKRYVVNHEHPFVARARRPGACSIREPGTT